MVVKLFGRLQHLGITPFREGIPDIFYDNRFSIAHNIVNNKIEKIRESIKQPERNYRKENTEGSEKEICHSVHKNSMFIYSAKVKI